MQDHTEGSSMQSHALETIQERLREAETGLRREQDSYRQMQVRFIFKYMSVKSRLNTWKNIRLINSLLCRRVSMPPACLKWRLRGRPSQRRWQHLSGEAEKKNSGLMTSNSN